MDKIEIPAEIRKQYWFDISNKGEPSKYAPDNERMIAKLLKDDVLFCNNATNPLTICIHVICNDTFCYASADCECVTTSELEDLFTRHIFDPIYGSLIWCCLKRKEKPLKEIVESLKKKNRWSNELNALPDNYCNAVGSILNTYKIPNEYFLKIKAANKVEETARLFNSLSEIVKKESIPEWLVKPNSAFNVLTPLELIERGEISRLYEMIEDLSSGNPN